MVRRGAFPSDNPAAPRRNRSSEMSKTLSVVVALIVTSILVIPTVSLADAPRVTITSRA